MKEAVIEIGHKELNNALKRVSAAVSANPTVPAMEFVHISINKNRAVFKSTDLHTTIKTVEQVMFCDQEEKVELLLPYAQVNKLLKVLPSTPITIKTFYQKGKYPSEDVYSLTLVSDSNEYKFETFDPKVFPAPETPQMETFKVNGGALAVAIDLCLTTCEKSGNTGFNPAFQGIHFCDNGGKISLQSISQNCITRRDLTEDIPSDFVPFLVRYDIAEIISGFCKSEVNINMATDDNKIIIQTKNVMAQCPLMEYNKLPSVNTLMKNDYPIEIQIEEGAELSNALKRCLIVTNRPTDSMVRFTVEKGRMIIETFDGLSKLQTSSQIINVEHNEDITFAANPALINQLIAGQQGQITFKMLNERTTGLIKFERDEYLTRAFTPGFLAV